jgi:hypothetical protein
MARSLRWLEADFLNSIRRLGDTKYDFESGRLTLEQKTNYVLCLFREDIMFRAVVEEAAALASITLFIGMIAIWAQVLGTL